MQPWLLSSSERSPFVQSSSGLGRGSRLEARRCLSGPFDGIALGCVHEIESLKHRFIRPCRPPPSPGTTAPPTRTAVSL